ncbi:lasso peptide [Calothrix sp. PCC 6303]|uniref:lasso peptide n=1 Tax=Calothrix sp. PCC 6303 TaxID=1170562 RepID=UPI0002A051AF|nr:lasso peptide [Calothrix sp. PCC 6303]AFZ00990.1 hypothetical protein Cal6303_1956 [Calothrix sp. PCC 6303]
MKKNYNAPVLTVHGSVEAITQMFGNSKTRNDFLFFPAAGTSIQANQLPNEFTNGFNTGSIDGCIGQLPTKQCPNGSQPI